MPDNSQVVNDAYAAFGRGDIPAILEMLDDGVEWEVTEILPQGGSFRGPDGVGEFFAGVGREWPELRIDIDELIADGSHVVGVGRAEGALADGEQAGYGFTHVFTIDDGKITRFREYAAPDAALR
jgi:uncharacterized protein